MKNKKVIAGLLIIFALTAAFFMSGTKAVVPLSPDEINNDAGLVKDIESLEVNIDGHAADKDVAEAEGEPLKLLKDKPIKEEAIQQKPEKKTGEKAPKDKAKSVGEKIKEQKAEKKKIIEEDNKNKDKKDKYLTDPVPEGKPKPVEWQEVKVNKEKKLSATLSVTCKSILNNMDMFNMDKLEVLPEDGIIYPTKAVAFYEGESVFDVLLREMQDNKIHMEFVMTPIYNSNYIAGINNLYEFDCGELSGWMYRVNKWFPNYGCSRYMLKDGDVIEWIYTCDLGRDIGGEWAVTGGEE
ncbi:DUF4430 domain-containing protein [Lutispora sp.]|uniref:DUF4430 domain-containing protein n=1 Tax=Lutispora sp. TaxID=2828727 RepID=UPI002B1E9585|nr:DUF4430 domain-containing protein [Lutispora sp.]MEA4960230.1 DUF4430 domain-containing protein [Lutispora sp.]